MKILLVNLHSSRNAGDDLLTRVTVQQLQSSFAKPALTLSLNDPASYEGPGTPLGSFITWFRRQDADLSLRHFLIFPFFLLETLFFVLLYRFVGLTAVRLAPHRHRPLLAAYFSSDLVISSAGNFLYSSGRLGLTFLLSIYTMAFAWLAGKPLYTMPQTIGPLQRSWERRLVRWIANRTQIMFVRDLISFETLRTMRVDPERFRAAPDLAFAYPPSPPAAGITLLTDYGLAFPAPAPRLGVTLMNWAAQKPAFTGQAAYETAVVHTIRTFIEDTGGQAILFSQVHGPTFIEDDRIPARRVQQQLVDCGHQVIFIEREVPTEVLKSAYGLMDLFIGTRLHSNIFAISEGVPALMVEYRYKTRGVMQMLDLDKWVVDIHTVSADSLCTKLKELQAAQALVRQQIGERLPAVIDEAAHVGHRIAVDFAALSQS